MIGHAWHYGWAMNDDPAPETSLPLAQSPVSSQRALDDLVALLDLEPIEVNLFRGISPDENRQRVFGGQVAGQALVAAARTIDEHSRLVHSLHAYFLRPGDPTLPILYEVDRIRDGRSFSTRRVVAIQHGRAIFNLQASFHDDEPGPDHQQLLPEGLGQRYDFQGGEQLSLQGALAQISRLNRMDELARQMDAKDFATMVIDNADEMLEQARRQPLVMGLALHPYIVGQPYRLRHLRRALAHLAGLRDRGEIWFTTPGDICRHMEQLEPT